MPNLLNKNIEPKQAGIHYAASIHKIRIKVIFKLHVQILYYVTSTFMG